MLVWAPFYGCEWTAECLMETKANMICVSFALIGDATAQSEFSI